MKSKIKSPEVNYPKLKGYGSKLGFLVVLFTSRGIGTCVYTTMEDGVVGEYSNIWGEDDFQDFNGTIELSNN